MTLPKPELPATSVLLIDGSQNQRTYWGDQLKRCSPDYEIVEAADGQSGLDLYRSQRIDCVVLEVALADGSGFPTLINFVPIASKPQVPVIVLTQIPYPTVWELAKENGAYACFHKPRASGEELDKAIRHAIAFVGQIPKDDRHQRKQTQNKGPAPLGIEPLL